MRKDKDNIPAPCIMADVDGAKLFRDANFGVLVPTCPDGLQLPPDGAEDADDAVRQWIATLEPQNGRSCCFYGMFLKLNCREGSLMAPALDESLSYVCHLSYRTEASSDAALRSTFERVCNAVRVRIPYTAECHPPADPSVVSDHDSM
jgi:hypothetical protein